MNTCLNLVLASLAAHTLFAATPDTTTFRYVGKVVDASGKPVPDAAVEIYRYQIRPIGSAAGLELIQRSTSTNGVVEANLDGSSAYLVLRKPGLATTWRQFNLSADLEQTIVLTPPTTIEGLVVDSADQPVAGVEVFPGYLFLESPRDDGGRTYHYLSDQPARAAFTTRTGPDGRFRLESFPTNGMANLAAEKPGLVFRETPRQSIGPSTMQCRAGQTDVKLVMDPAGSIEGTVMLEQTKGPAPRATVSAQSQTPGIRFSVPKPALTDAEGRFRIEGLAAGSWRLVTVLGTNRPPELVADWVTASVEAGQTTRDITITAGPGGLLEVKVVGKEDRKPVPDATVGASRAQFQGIQPADGNGVGMVRLPPGTYRVTGYKQGWRAIESATEVTIEPGRTNRLEIELEPPARIVGTVRDPSGASVTNLLLKLVPEYRANVGPVRTDAQGHFEFAWSPQRGGSLNEKVCLLARDTNRLLAAAVDLEDDTRLLDIRLEPGLTIIGNVEDEGNKPISNATVNVYLWAGNSGSSFDKALSTDAAGKFSLSGLPPGRRYSASVNAKGYGSGSSGIKEPEESTRTIELETFTLRVADRPLAGQVLDAEEKPVARANVHIYGQGQPNASVQTDDKGFFKFEAVCEGTVRLSASHQSQYGNVSAEGGDTNVVLVLGRQASVRRVTPARTALIGRPLPDLAAFGLPATVLPKDRPALICLFDCEQRPSRRCLSLLAGQYDALRQKGLSVAAIQATVVEAETLKAWRESNPVHFPLGQVPEKSDQAKWITAQDAFPWLILVNAKGLVAAEGFTLDELEAKIESLPK